MALGAGSAVQVAVAVAHDRQFRGGRARRRPQPYDSPAFLRAANWSIPLGYIAVTAGWVTTEVGRQPWVVYGHLRTAHAVSPSLTGGDVMASLALYVIVYALIFGAGFYYLIRLVQRLTDQQRAEARAVDEQIAFDLRARIQANGFDEPSVVVHEDVGDLSFDAFDAIAFAELAQESGVQARIDMEAFFQKKIFLDLYVRVNENWRTDQKLLRRFGYSE